MLDIKFIRENQETLRNVISGKNIDLDLDSLLALDRDRISLQQELEGLQSEKNEINRLIQSATTPEERARVIEKGKVIKAKIDDLEPKAREAKQAFDRLMVRVPNIVASDTPAGKSDAENVEVMTWGEKPSFGFSPRTHIELGEALDIIDFDRGAKVSGYRGYYLKNEGSLLVVGLMMYALQKLVSKGYTPIIPPTLVNRLPLFGSGYFKGVEYDGSVDEIYQVATGDLEADGTLSKEQKFLVGTAEPSLLAYYSGETLDMSLPLKLAGFSQCYRSEIGSYGKDTKGLYRVHEFFKVEQVVLAAADAEAANAIQEEMVAISEEMHRELGLSYRKLRICMGDLSAGKYKQYDLEAWMPGLDRYGETGSASNFLDWQSRRLDVKYKDTATGERKHVFMLNNTALPSPRILIAILENYQQKDGSVVIPEVLRPFVGKEKIEKK